MKAWEKLKENVGYIAFSTYTRIYTSVDKFNLKFPFDEKEIEFVMKTEGKDKKNIKHVILKEVGMTW